MPTPSSAAMMPARVVLPNPGGPYKSTWSIASPRLRAASIVMASCSFTLDWPAKSASRRGRRVASNCRSSSRSDAETMPCSLMKPAHLSFSVAHRLMTQVVDEIIHRDPVSERGPLFRIPRLVGNFPRVAEVHVVANGHHDSPFAVANAAPMRYFPGLALLVSDPRLEILRARHLKPVVQIVDGVENRIVVGNIFDFAVRKHAVHAVREDLPLVDPLVVLQSVRTVEVIDHQK